MASEVLATSSLDLLHVVRGRGRGNMPLRLDEECARCLALVSECGTKHE